MSLETWPTLTSGVVLCTFGSQTFCANFVVMQETNSCFTWQHRSRDYLMGCRSSNGWDPRTEFMGSHWRVRTISSVRPAAMAKTTQREARGWTPRFTWRWRFCDTEPRHFQRASISLCFRRQTKLWSKWSLKTESPTWDTFLGVRTLKAALIAREKSVARLTPAPTLSWRYIDAISTTQ